MSVRQPTMDGEFTRAAAIIRPTNMQTADVQKTVTSYIDHYNKGDADERKKNYANMINAFYDVVTNFYEFGWGESFHFAPRKTWESFETSIRRHEMYLAHRIHLFEGMTAIDLGCGVGGPARCISVFSEAKVVGLNNNQYQVDRARKLTAEAGLNKQVSFVKGDFMHIPADDNTYDAAYGIEATCHAPDRVGCYSEAFRVLKPGGHFGLYEWVMTEKYDPTNPEHVAIKEGVERGNGLPELILWSDCENAIKEAGFELLETRDLCSLADSKTPWYLPLSGSLSISGFKHTRWGRWATNKMLGWLEWAHVAPKGSTEVSNILCDTAEQLVKGGELGIFSPAWFILARKPVKE